MLWHAATILREHRGHGHLVPLQAHHLDPVEPLVLHAGAGAGAGTAVRTAVEKLTDELAAAPWSALSSGEAARLADLLVPPVLDIVATGLLPAQSTLGIGMKYDYADS